MSYYYNNNNNNGTPRGGSRNGHESRARKVVFSFPTHQGRFNLPRQQDEGTPHQAHPSNDPSQPQPPPRGRQLRDIHIAATAYAPAAEAKREGQRAGLPTSGCVYKRLAPAATCEAATAWTPNGAERARRRHRRRERRPTQPHSTPPLYRPAHRQSTHTVSTDPPTTSVVEQNSPSLAALKNANYPQQPGPGFTGGIARDNAHRTHTACLRQFHTAYLDPTE